MLLPGPRSIQISSGLMRTHLGFFIVVGRECIALQQTLALGLLARQLALATDGLGVLARLAHGGFLKMLLELHLAEHPFTLKFFLQGTQRLIDVVITNTYLREVFATSRSVGYAKKSARVLHPILAPLLLSSNLTFGDTAGPQSRRPNTSVPQHPGTGCWRRRFQCI